MWGQPDYAGDMSVDHKRSQQYDKATICRSLREEVIERNLFPPRPSIVCLFKNLLNHPMKDAYLLS